MASEEVHSLAVRIHPEGARETREELEGVSDTFEESTDRVAESAGIMSGFARKFRGAGLVFAGVFGTLVAGIASKMPILRESAAGMEAILTSLGLVFDREARPALNRYNQTVFELAGRIAEAEGPLDALRIAFLDTGIEANTAAERMNGASDNVQRFQGVLNRFNINPFVNKVVSGFNVVVTDGINLFRSAIGGIGDWLAEQFAGAKSVVQDQFIDPLIQEINNLIRLANQIPGANINTINQGGNGGGGNGGMTRAEARGLFENEASAPGLGSSGRNRTFGGGILETEVNLDGQRVGSAVKPFTVTGTLSRGRGFRFR